MKISVTKNEYNWAPDIANNLDLPEKDQFTFVLQKKSYTLNSQEWSKYDEHKNYVLDKDSFIRAHVVRIDNPPDLELTPGTKEAPGEPGEMQTLTIDILLSGKYPELMGIVEELFLKIGEIDSGEIEVKKS